ncbi:MAG: thioredoxin [uncultured archaeon A07HR60]|jgi:Thioredoxin.|nr:MAG: thioredoxin [uncultured archaeon A07HR60]
MSDSRNPDTLLDELHEEGVVCTTAAANEFSTTEEFEGDRQVYYDTYKPMSDEHFHQSVADVFDLASAAEAADRVAELGVSREEFATFLTLRTSLDGAYDTLELTTMAQMATELNPETPVPDDVTHLDDDSYESFVTDHDRCIISVWKLFCGPCDAMKAELDDVLAAFPDDAPVGGIAGERSPDFRESIDVNAAPAFVLFDAGEPVEIITGRTDPSALADRSTEVYGD